MKGRVLAGLFVVALLVGAFQFTAWVDAVRLPAPPVLAGCP